jgi:guanylate kinase
MLNKRPGIVFVICAPSGAGKTSLVNAVVADIDALNRSISHTTRPKRPKEVQGVDYHFVNNDEFDVLVKQKAFVEDANVYDHRYGTSLQAINTPLNQGEDVILDIDWQGARNIKAHYPKNTASIFVLPPSKDVLYERLCLRKQDDAATIDRRMLKAKSEMQHYDEFDYLLINENFDETLQRMKSIIFAERSRLFQQVNLSFPLINTLLGG